MAKQSGWIWQIDGRGRIDETKDETSRFLREGVVEIHHQRRRALPDRPERKIDRYSGRRLAFRRDVRVKRERYRVRVGRRVAWCASRPRRRGTSREERLVRVVKNNERGCTRARFNPVFNPVTLELVNYYSKREWKTFSEFELIFWDAHEKCGVLERVRAFV